MIKVVDSHDWSKASGFINRIMDTGNEQWTAQIQYLIWGRIERIETKTHALVMRIAHIAKRL